MASGMHVCAHAPVSAWPQGSKQVMVAQPVLTFEHKMAWILMLEDRRVLDDAKPFPTPLPAAPDTTRGKKPAVAPPPPPRPDLRRLLTDNEARIRRRAALAVGRVGLADGVSLLLPLLAKDADPEVRQMAAFALGLVGSRTAVEPLRAALAESVSPRAGPGRRGARCPWRQGLGSCHCAHGRGTRQASGLGGDRAE